VGDFGRIGLGMHGRWYWFVCKKKLGHESIVIVPSRAVKKVKDFVVTSDGEKIVTASGEPIVVTVER